MHFCRPPLSLRRIPFRTLIPYPLTVMETPKITAYLKTYCGWSEGVRAIMRKYDLPYEEKDIIANPAFRWEMEQKSGQPLSPCVEINGKMLPDISGEEVEKYLVENSSSPAAMPRRMPRSIRPAPTSSTRRWPARWARSSLFRKRVGVSRTP